MDIGPIASRYARALLTFAMENGNEELAYKQTKLLMANYRKIPELRQAIENPTVGEREKVSVLRNATAGKKTCKEMVRFFHVLLDNKREKMLPFILSSYLFHYRKKKRIRQCKLITAAPLPQKTLEEIKTLILKNYRGRKVEFDTKIDPNIIGGTVLEIGYWRIDTSVTGQLRRIKKEFIERNRRIV